MNEVLTVEATIGGRERSQKCTHSNSKEKPYWEENRENRVGTTGKADKADRHFIQMEESFFIRRNCIQLFVTKT